MLIIIGAAALTAAVAVTAVIIIAHIQMSKIPGMSFDECLSYTTGGNRNAVITVGKISGGEMSWTVYGEDGKQLPQELHTYEAGSLTKTFTAALVNRAVQEGMMKLNAPISDYIPLPEKEYYPDISSILTHTSGYSSYYFESPMTGNFFGGRNSFCGIGDSMVRDRLGRVNIERKKHRFDYSNFGYAALGLALENVYQTEFTTLMNEYCSSLGLEDTHISDGNGDLGRLWDWEPGDTYLSAGGLTTNIEDMLRYAQLQLDGESGFAQCHEPIEQINAASKSYQAMGIRMDSIGMAWITDSENGFVWHNGGTGNYNSYLGFSPENNCAVVILSNLAPGYRIPATVMGTKLLSELCG